MNRQSLIERPVIVLVNLAYFAEDVVDFLEHVIGSAPIVAKVKIPGWMICQPGVVADFYDSFQSEIEKFDPNVNIDNVKAYMETAEFCDQVVRKLIEEIRGTGLFPDGLVPAAIRLIVLDESLGLSKPVTEALNRCLPNATVCDDAGNKAYYPFSAPVSALQLGARITFSLEIRGIDTVGSLAACNESRLSDISGIGKKTIAKIKTALAGYDAELSQG